MSSGGQLDVERLLLVRSVTAGKTSTLVTAASTWGDRDMTARTAAEWSPMNSIPTVP